MDPSNEFREELEGLPPFLRQMKGRDEGFRVPPGYFEALPGQEAFRTPVRMAWLARYQRSLRAIAAALALLLISAAAYWHWQQLMAQEAVPALAEVSLAEIPEADIHAYIVDNIGDFEGEIAAVFPPGQLADPSVARESTTPDIPLPAAAELEDYLLDRLEDLETSDLEAVLDQ
jgi:hypothetical protein